MLRQAVRLTSEVSALPRISLLLTDPPKEAPGESLTEKWLKGLFDDDDKKKKKDSTDTKKDDDDQEGGQMMPIPPGLAGLYFARSVDRRWF